MRTTSSIALVAFFALVASPPKADARENSGTTAAPILKLDIGARPIGMGGAFVAIADDIYGIRYNPAGIGQFYFPQISSMYISGLADSSLVFQGFGIPLPFPGFSGQGYPSVAGSVLYSQSGEIEWNRTNPDGSFLSTEKLRAGSDLVATLAYGEKVGENNVMLAGYNAQLEHYFGVAFKYIYSELVEEYSAWAMAFDIGYLAVETELGLALGVSVANIGGKMKFVSESDPLPIVFRGGLSYQKPTVMDQSLRLSVEYDRYLHEKESRLRGGLEYLFEKIFSFRLGYQGLQDAGGITAGVGIQQGGLSLDFSMTFEKKTLTNTHQVSLSYKFRTARRTVQVKKSRLKSDEFPVYEEEKKPEKKLKGDPIPGWIY